MLKITKHAQDRSMERTGLTAVELTKRLEKAIPDSYRAFEKPTWKWVAGLKVLLCNNTVITVVDPSLTQKQKQ